MPRKSHVSENFNKFVEIFLVQIHHLLDHLYETLFLSLQVQFKEIRLGAAVICETSSQAKLLR